MFAPYYKEVTKPIPRSKVYSGYKDEKPLKVQIGEDIQLLKQMAAQLESKHETYPHHEQLFTQQAEHAPDTNLLQTPYRDMHYMEMIMKFRRDNKKDNDFYRSFEKDRKYM